AGLAQPLAGDPEGERYRLFEAVAALLREVAATRPVVLVLDDLHWADKPTLLLLRHLARDARPTALLVLGTYREAEVKRGHPLSDALAVLGRSERVSLGPLDARAVEGLVAGHAGDHAPELVARLVEQAEGNPFFVVEMLAHLAEAPGELGIPEGVRDVVGRRIDRLAAATRDVLAIASVAGRAFEYVVLARVTGLDEDRLVAALDEAVRARVVEERAGRYAFTHALIRETIYASLTRTRRALLHRRIAAALEQLEAADPGDRSAELAHHFALSGSAADVDKAIDHGARAGDAAIAQLAYEQAAARYRRAAGLIDGAGLRGRDAQRCDLVIAQGEAERQAGDPSFRATLLEGARLATALGDAERLARAALANNRGFFSGATAVDRERVAVLDAALAAHGEHDSAVRARLLAQVAVELAVDPDWRRRARLSDEAVAIARRVGDPRALARTLNDRYVALWGPRTLAERLSSTREASALVASLDDPVASFQAARFGAHAAMEAGELDLADARLRRADELARQLGQPIIHWYVAVTRAKRTSISGPPAQAERLAREAFEVGQRLGQPEASLWLLLQRFVARFLQGTLGDAPTPVAAPAGAGPRRPPGTTASRSVPMLVAALQAATACEAGDGEGARARFEALAGELGDLPYDWLALLVPAVASVACARLGDAPSAATLHERLEPYAGRFVDAGRRGSARRATTSRTSRRRSGASTTPTSASARRRARTRGSALARGSSAPGSTGRGCSSPAAAATTRSARGSCSATRSRRRGAAGSTRSRAGRRRCSARSPETFVKGPCNVRRRRCEPALPSVAERTLP
ncbi:MAG: hypothetical protein QOJ35_1545, partial [Solirubrobacteraceae bacterium]|nr:hypothetical protein [Solirubrobacteraceae bacterium]